MNLLPVNVFNHRILFQTIDFINQGWPDFFVGGPNSNKKITTQAALFTKFDYILAEQIFFYNSHPISSFLVLF